jgi:hypothetical protein
MALTVPYPKVQGSKAYLGPDLQMETVLIIPGTSDYTTNGYIVTAVECGFKMIQSAIVSGGNVTAYPTNPTVTRYAFPVFPESQLATSSQGFTGYSQFLLKVYVGSTGAEAAALANLTGYIWQVTIIGY